jgi:type IV pilus assembly protein PilA
MKQNLAWFGAAVILMIGAGCDRKPAVKESIPAPAAVTLVPVAERSRHFEIVNQHLELGGTLYIYADVDGDALKIAATVRNIAENFATIQPAAAPFLKQDFQKLFAKLGLDDIKALGLSSVPVGGGGFRNNVFLYAPGGRHGLLAGLGGPAGAFTGPKLAPADVDLFGESEIDLPAVYSTIKAVVAQVAGDATADLMETKLKEAGKPAGLSVLDVIQSLKGRMAIILRLDPRENLKLPGPAGVQIPAFSLLMRVEGVGPALEGALERLPILEKSQEGALKVYTLKTPLPVPNLRPLLAVEGSTLYFATTKEFLTECRQHTEGLDQNPAFKQALASIGDLGNGVSYVSPRLFARLRQLEELNSNATPEVRRVLKMWTGQIPVIDRPLVTMRSNLQDGILVRSFSNRSLKQDVAMISVYNPVTVGMLAAMAIPAFQKVREASQEKAVLNNLSQLHAAAERHYLEHGVDTAAYDDLVGPDKYIRRIVPVAGEDYRQLTFKQGQPLRVRLPSGRAIEFRPGRNRSAPAVPNATAP